MNVSNYPNEMNQLQGDRGDAVLGDGAAQADGAHGPREAE